MVYADKLHDIIRPLEQGGIVLLPTDTIWCLACALSAEEAVHRLRKVAGLPLRDPVTMLVTELRMLKRYVRLHPRIETLHLHHVRPLTVLYDHPRRTPEYILNEFGGLSCRIVDEEFVSKVIDLLGEPLVAVHGHTTGTPWPEEFADLEKDIIAAADYVCQHRQDDDCNDPAVVVTYDKDGDLIFLND